MENLESFDSVISHYEENKARLGAFQTSVVSFFENHYQLNNSFPPVIHSIKTRLKDPVHLRDKLKRKMKNGIKVTPDNLFKEITDLIGVRVLHLYQDQFALIHNAIQKQVEEGEWAFIEAPKAFTWDPESKGMYEKLGIETDVRPTFYTSVHYLVKPDNNNNNPICCEIQVRTLFEEIWGEINHSINYPYQINDVACKEQLRVLSKLVSTGTRLADSIFRSLNDYKRRTEP